MLQDAWHQRSSDSRALLNLTPFHTLAPHLAPHCSPRRLGACGFPGQEIRETCQPVVLSKHIFYPAPPPPPLTPLALSEELKEKRQISSLLTKKPLLPPPVGHIRGMCSSLYEGKSGPPPPQTLLPFISDYLTLVPVHTLACLRHMRARAHTARRLGSL